MNAVVVAAERPALGADVIGQNPVAALALSFGRRVLDHLLGFGGEADHQARALRTRLGKPGQDVGVGGQRKAGGTFVSLLQLLVGRSGDLPIGNGSGADRNVAWQAVEAGRQHLLGRAYVLHAYALRVRQAGRPRDQCGVRPQVGQGLGDCVALLARRAIGDVAHRVDRLMGGAAGYQGTQAFQAAA